MNQVLLKFLLAALLFNSYAALAADSCSGSGSFLSMPLDVSGTDPDLNKLGLSLSDNFAGDGNGWMLSDKESGRLFFNEKGEPCTVAVVGKKKKTFCGQEFSALTKLNQELALSAGKEEVGTLQVSLEPHPSIILKSGKNGANYIRMVNMSSGTGNNRKGSVVIESYKDGKLHGSLTAGRSLSDKFGKGDWRCLPTKVPSPTKLENTIDVTGAEVDGISEIKINYSRKPVVTTPSAQAPTTR
jgi:hypothetical protein